MSTGDITPIRPTTAEKETPSSDGLLKAPPWAAPDPEFRIDAEMIDAHVERSLADADYFPTHQDYWHPELREAIRKALTERKVVATVAERLPSAWGISAQQEKAVLATQDDSPAIIRTVFDGTPLELRIDCANPELIVRIGEVIGDALLRATVDDAKDRLGFGTLKRWDTQSLRDLAVLTHEFRTMVGNVRKANGLSDDVPF